MAALRLLLCDDDRALLDLLALALTDAGYQVSTASDGLKAWAAYESEQPDLVILDVMMPQLDGLELCRRIRAAGRTPVVMLTSKDEELDKVLGLELGADDYVTKPFSTRELVARLKAVTRRAYAAPSPGERRSVGALSIDRERRELSWNGVVIVVTATEFELVWALCGRPGIVCSRDEVIDAVYGPEVHVTDRTIDTFVKRLRKKLREVDPSFDALETVRSVGYRWRA